MTKKISMPSFGRGGGGASASLTEKQKKQNRLRRVMSTPDASMLGQVPPSSVDAASGKGGASSKNRRRRHTVQSGANLPHLAPPTALPSIMKVATLDESLHSKYSSSSAGGGTRSTRTSTTASDDTLTTNNSVEFLHVEVREYKRAMGDNPSVQAGPPIGIGWEIEERLVVPIDDYETYKREAGIHEADQLSFILPRAERERLLMENGYTRKDIADAVREVVRSKSRRRTTVVNLGRTTVVEEAVQSLMRKFKRNVLGKDKDIEYSAHHERWAAEADRAARIILEENLAAAAEEACIDIDDIDPSEFVDDANDDIRTNLKSGRSRAATEALLEAKEEVEAADGPAADEALRSSRTSSITAVEEDEVAMMAPAVPPESASTAQSTNKPPPIKIFVAADGEKHGADASVVPAPAPTPAPAPAPAPAPHPSVQDDKVHGEDFAPPKVAYEEGVHGEDFAKKKQPMTPPPMTAKLFGKDLPAAKDLVKIPAPATKLFQEMGRAA